MTIALYPLPAVAAILDQERARIVEDGIRDLVADRARRLRAYAKAREYRADVMALRDAIRILGVWEACQTGAGTFGDLYADMDLCEALDVARLCWRETMAEMRSE